MVDVKQRLREIEDTIRDIGETPHLVGYDANEIQELISGCSRLVAMRGASEAILEFDREVRSRHRAVFAGGGRGMVLARSSEEAERMASALSDRFRAMTQGGVAAACWVPVEASGDAQMRGLRWLRHRLDLAKGAAAPPGGDVPTSRDDECACCRRYRAAIESTRDDRPDHVCSRCFEMIGRGRKSDRAPGERVGAMSQSIEEIAEDGWIAMVSADGNSLGALFDSLHGLAETAVMSEVIGEIFRAARTAALDAAGAHKCVPLLAGGDDVRAFIPPSRAIAYVERLVEVVESEAARYAGELEGLVAPGTVAQLRKLGIGIGVAIANVYYPSWRLMDLAHDLEDSAKTLRTARSALDFAIVTTEDALTGKPARPDDLRPLSMDRASWKRALERAGWLSKIPKAQLGVLASRANESAEELANALRYQVARSQHWRDWYQACGVDWRDAKRVVDERPGRGALELMRLLDKSREEGRP